MGIAAFLSDIFMILIKKNIAGRILEMTRMRKLTNLTENITNLRRANCSQTTDDRLASSVANHGLVRIALAWFDSAIFSFPALLLN